jgi:hypothetical protein
MAQMSTAHLITAVGVLLVLVSLLADVLGIGGEPRFGYKQWAGLIVGIALVVYGVRRSRARK